MAGLDECSRSDAFHDSIYNVIAGFRTEGPVIRVDQLGYVCLLMNLRKYDIVKEGVVEIPILGDFQYPAQAAQFLIERLGFWVRNCVRLAQSGLQM